tara:strand:- start:73 stop:498 length:426 start_codon:yes stop_codon:yes gene_type:complete
LRNLNEIDNITGNTKEPIATQKTPYIEFFFDEHDKSLCMDANLEGLEVFKNEISSIIDSKGLHRKSHFFEMEKSKAITFGDFFLESIEIVDKLPPKKVNEENKKSSIELEVIGCLLVVALIGIIFIVGFITSIKYLIFQFL